MHIFFLLSSSSKMDPFPRPVQVVTVATHSQGYLQSLKWCLARAGSHEFIRFVELGRGQKWRNYCDKIRLLDEFLTGRKESEQDGETEEDLVIFCDAYDVLYDHRRDFERLVHIFEASGADLLFSVVDVSRLNRVIQKCAHKILACLDVSKSSLTCNGGLYMGRRRALRVLMREIRVRKSEQIDDERCINQILNESCISSQLMKSSVGFAHFEIRIREQVLNVALDVDSLVFHNSPAPISPLSLVRTFAAEPTTFERGQAFFYHFIGNQNLDDLCAYEGIWRPECVGNCEIYGKADKLSHYLKFFNAEIAALTLAFGLSVLLLLTIK